MKLPDYAKTATVVGSIHGLLADGPDPDNLPDIVDLAGASAVLQPDIGFLIGSEGLHTIVCKRIVFEFDEAGLLKPVTVLATDDKEFMPKDRKWAYNLTVRLPGIEEPIKKTGLELLGGVEYRFGALLGVASQVTLPAPTLDLAPVIARVNQTEHGLAAVRALSEGYEVIEMAGARTVSTLTASSWRLEMTDDATLTIEGRDGQSIVLHVKGGKKLTIVDGPTITSPGVYSLFKSEGMWLGGAAAAAPTGSTGGTAGGGGTSTPAPSVVEIGHLDATDVADGTKINTLKLSNGLPFEQSQDACVVQGGWLVPGSGIVRTNDVLTAKQMISVDYDITSGAPAVLMAGHNGGVGSSAMFRISSSSEMDIIFQSNSTFTAQMDPPLVTPTKGRMAISFDSTNGTGAVYINGEQVGTYSSSNYDTTKKAGGGGFWGGARFQNFKIEAMK